MGKVVGLLFGLISLLVTLQETKLTSALLHDARSSSSPTCEALGMNLQGWSRGCGCKYQNSGEIVSLYELQSNSSKDGDPKFPRFEGHDNIGWYYSFNPCTDFGKFQNEVKKYPGYRPCKSVAAARWTNESTHQCDGLGEQNKGEFNNVAGSDLDNFTVSTLILTFRNSSTKYGMQLSLVCNKNMSIDETTFTYLGTQDKPDSTYYFKLESVCCCPNGCKSGYHPSKQKGSSEVYYIIGAVAGVLLLLLLFALVLYLMRRRYYMAEYQEQRPLLQEA